MDDDGIGEYPIECDGYIPGEFNGCLKHVDEWWAERGMNLCHACGLDQREIEVEHWDTGWDSPCEEGYHV